MSIKVKSKVTVSHKDIVTFLYPRISYLKYPTG